MKITIYTMKSCPFCVMAKKLLTSRGLSFEEIMVPMDDDAQWKTLERRSGMTTMPQIFHGDRLIGGYQQLAELDSRDQLRSLN